MNNQEHKITTKLIYKGAAISMTKNKLMVELEKPENEISIPKLKELVAKLKQQQNELNELKKLRKIEKMEKKKKGVNN